ncbi:MAG TPA: hypothetical protein VK102_07750 [Sphingobacterium sp.]|nr:hypothetical protein [Sphingobacterium sp.]
MSKSINRILYGLKSEQHFIKHIVKMILELLSSQLKEQTIEAYIKIVEQDKTANRIYVSNLN